MRANVGVSVACVACIAWLAVLSAQSDQPPVFKSSVDLLDVDVSVIDKDGRPIADLTGADFLVTVDGRPRQVINAEFITDATAAEPSTPAFVDPYISNNTDRQPGRLIVLVVDQNNMTMEKIRGAIGAIGGFIASLAPSDRVALVAIPSPEPMVNFTTNHRQVLDAIAHLVGYAEVERGRFNISDAEAMAFDDQADNIITQRMMLRLCGDIDPDPMSTCGSDVEQEAMRLAQQLKTRTIESVSALGALLNYLREFEGSKSVVLLSQGLMVGNSSSETGALSQLAAEARASINVMLFDWTIGAASERIAVALPRADQNLRESGLEGLASRSRGALFRIPTNPEYMFKRLALEMSGHYILGVESTPADHDGKFHNLQVKVSRQGVQVRSRRQFHYVVRAPNGWSRDDLMGRLLRAPSPAREIPMHLTAYTYRDLESQSNKLIVAADLDPATTGDVDVAVGHALYDTDGRVVLMGQERKIYSANMDRPLRYEIALGVDPGVYRLRVAAVDQAGRTGSVERVVHAWPTFDREFAVGDLILARVHDAQARNFRPPILLSVDDGQVGAFTEAYTNKPGTLDGASVAFEIAEDTETPALRRDVVRYRPQASGVSAQASSIIPLGSLPPGRYVVRAVVSRGDHVEATLVRPFMLLPVARPAPGDAADGDAPAAAPAAAATPAPVVADYGVVSAAAFRRESVLTPSMLSAVFDTMGKAHPRAKAAFAKARDGRFDGTALMAFDAGDEAAAAVLRGLELFAKGQLDPAATQFGVALRNAPDSALAAFYLGACYAAAGRDREALANWEKARATLTPLPEITLVMAEAWLRLGQPAQAIDPLAEALERHPQDQTFRKNLAVAQSQLGRHEQAYATIAPYLTAHQSDADALMVALQAIYQVHAEGKAIESQAQDRANAAAYARAYATAGGPNQPLVQKWLQFLGIGEAGEK